MMIDMTDRSVLSGVVPARLGPPAGRRPTRLPIWLADQVEASLLEGRYAVGAQMPTEQGLAESYGVSRQVVREATRLLEDRGLVDIRPGRGMTVLAPDVDVTVQRFRALLQRGEASFRQLMQLRHMTESEMAAIAALNRTADDLQRMQAAIEQASAHVDDYDACLESDLAFHEAVARATHNPFVMAFVLPINATLRDSYRWPISYLATQPHTLAEHRAIADAIADRDVDAARLVTTRHLDRILVDAAHLIGGGPDADDQVGRTSPPTPGL